MITQKEVNAAYQDGLRDGQREIFHALHGLDESASCTIGQVRQLAVRLPVKEKDARTILGLDPAAIARRALKPAVARPAAAVRVPPATPKRVQPPTAAPVTLTKPAEESAAAMGRRIAEKFDGAEQTKADDSAAVMGSRIAAQFEGRKEAVA